MTGVLLQALSLLTNPWLSRATTTDELLGDPKLHTVRRELPIPHSRDRLLLFAYEAAPPTRVFRNLLRCHPDNSVVWHARLPLDTYAQPYSKDATDCYTDAAILEFGFVRWVEAFSWSCYSVCIELRSGRLIRRTFTK
jgi:hypothetical protein